MTLAAFDFTTRVRPVIQLGIGDSRTATGAVWDTGRWDTPPAYWAGLEPQWLDITCHAHSAELEYGRRAATDRFVPGAAVVRVDNTTGWADPNTTDPPGVLSVRPGRPIRVAIVHAVYGPRVLFRGWVDTMIPTYEPGEADAVDLVCIDALGEVNRAKLQRGPLVGAGETTTARLHRILDAIGWHPRDLGPSAEPLLGTDLAGQVADLLGLSADSAGGVVFGDTEGRVAFRPRDWQTYAPDTPVDATIGNVPATASTGNRVTFDTLNYLEAGEQVIDGYTAAVADVCPTGWERPFARADITTRAIIGRDADTAVVLDDPAGIARYGIEPFERTDLITERDSTLELLAARVLRNRSDATAPRVRSVGLDAATADNALDLMSTVDVYRPSRYRCRLVYPRGVVFDDEYFATGVTHNITPSSWTLQLNLDVAAPFAATGGRWDTGEWDRVTWADAVAQLTEPIGVLT